MLEILPKPQESVKKEPATPKPQQVEREIVRSEVPPATEEAKPTSDADTTPTAEVLQETAPPPKRSLVPILVAVALVIIAGYALLNSHNQRAAWEQQYQTAAELFAEEIAALRDALPERIAEQEQIDAERAAILAQQQKPKPPQTFNYGGNSTDTGPGSGHSLREDYGDPEDLYEDGDYDDLDEAWDEWEKGW